MLALLAAAAAWAMPDQALWTGPSKPEVFVRLLPPADIHFSGNAAFKVQIGASSSGFSLSPFLIHTRGIAYEVRDAQGVLVEPAEPVVGSPPGPPLTVDQLVPATTVQPVILPVGDRARWIFPKPGTYTVSAILVLMRFPGPPSAKPGDPSEYARYTSPPVTVTVAP